MSDYIDKAVGDIWFVFGESSDGAVDLNDGVNDIFTHITKEQAEKLIAIRATFLQQVREVYETMPRLGADQSPNGRGMLREPEHAWVRILESLPRRCSKCRQRELRGVGPCK